MPDGRTAGQPESGGRRIIYLDHASTTPLDPRVLDAMLPFFSGSFGNPSSVHELGRDARAGVDWARGTLARLLNCRPRELVFTSGATEANNLAIKGAVLAAARRAGGRRVHVITTAIEHHAVLHAVEALERFGVSVTVVPVSPSGIVDPEAVEAAIRPDTVLISVMLANNEVGTIQPVREIALIARQRGVLIHTDAVQAAGALALDVDDLGVDMLSISAHKFYGPKGVGLLYVRDGTPLDPLVDGGGQEFGRRAGTENVPGIVGMAVALSIADEEREARNRHAQELRDLLIEGILERVPDSRVNGDRERRLPNNANILIPGIDGESVLVDLDLNGVAASSGSACASASNEPSHVLLAIGLSEDEADGSLRLTVGVGNTREEIERATEVIASSVERVRSLMVRA